MRCRGIRGAITTDDNTKASILEATRTLLQALVSENGVGKEDIASIFFTCTPDLSAAFPAEGARELGFTDVPLLCAQEIAVQDALPRCIRILLHVNTDKGGGDLSHLYLRGASVLRPDQVKPDARAPSGEGQNVVGVVGLGLIGGSLGLALRAAGVHVIGFDPDEATRSLALHRGVIDSAASSAAELAQAELIFLATPIHTLVAAAEDLAEVLNGRTLVTDVGSVKGALVEKLHAIFEGRARFVGGHPMFGRERSGLQNADAALLPGAKFVLTPLPGTDSQAVEALCDWVKKLQMTPVVMDPFEHDTQVAALSHLPYAIAVALTRSVEQTQAAGSGFRGATRLALGPVEMWSSVLELNRPAVTQWAACFWSELSHLLGLEGEALCNALREAQKLRESLEGGDVQPDAPAERVVKG